MDKRLRPLPWPWGSKARRDEYKRLIAAGWLPEYARERIKTDNIFWRINPVPNERCLARTRTGGLCQRRAGINGRCSNHGGATPKRPHKTPESRARSLANLKQYRGK